MFSGHFSTHQGLFRWQACSLESTMYFWMINIEQKSNGQEFPNCVRFRSANKICYVQLVQHFRSFYLGGNMRVDTGLWFVWAFEVWPQLALYRGQRLCNPRNLRGCGDGGGEMISTEGRVKMLLELLGVAWVGLEVEGWFHHLFQYFQIANNLPSSSGSGKCECWITPCCLVARRNHIRSPKGEATAHPEIWTPLKET